jgi:heptosyltransferase I
VLPVISTLKDYNPDIKITWIIGKREYQLLSHIKDINFIIFDKSKSLSSLLKVRRALSSVVFDAMLLLQTSLRANIVSSVIKSKRKIGYDNIRSKEGHRFFVNEKINYNKNQHVVDSFMSFLDKLNIRPKRYHWNYFPSTTSNLLVKKFYSDTKTNILISPCSSVSTRNWHPYRYSKLIDQLHQHYNCNIILCGGKSKLENEMGNQICQLTESSPINLIGKDTLHDLIELIRNAQLLISPDSGPVHLATCLNTPVIGLYAATDPFRSGPYNDIDNCINKYMVAKKIYNITSNKWSLKIHNPKVMDLIEVDDVLQKIKLILEKHKGLNYASH